VLHVVQPLLDIEVNKNKLMMGINQFKQGKNFGYVLTLEVDGISKFIIDVKANGLHNFF
jgi:hypothetical protein